jgi:anaphase-promoting complex subunit 10
MRLFLDFAADESYTPTRMVFLAGSGNNDLVEWGEMRLEQPRGWIWADFSGVGEVDSGESSDDDDDEEEGNDGVPPGLTGALDEDDGSDYENAEPTPSGEGVGLGSASRRGRARLTGRTTGPGTGTGTGSAMGRAGAGGGGQITPMNIDLHGTPIQHPSPTPNLNPPHPHLPPHSHQLQQTPTLPPPSLHRTHPRRALQSLTPKASPQIPAPKEKKHKIPVLRAHLVQIKILENHQNGKDTHLRGLQIFARENEGERERPREKGLVGKNVGLGDGVKGRRERKSRGVGGMGLDMGTGTGMRGLGRSAWDVEPGIR